MTKSKMLNEIIDKSGIKRGYIAQQMGLSRFGLLKKINGENEFKANEIQKMCNILEITNLEKKEEIFFD